ncbi:hypothetical protein SAMN05216516_105168 [Izhakiella capsodis]|uniref:Uncharacterized protein n=1 Tax=Izhakiella capsodis TaxID=1367852 RepID=A0A1I4Y2E6_9GAMM|nr:hypothetical protein SAMN05216516_105168 [Izhakiella capsodis]
MQKMAENNGGYKAGYPQPNGYMRRAGLINVGGAAGGVFDLADAMR